VLRGNLTAALENIALWHERDISHSSVERVILPDSTILIVHMLKRFNGVMENMIVYPVNLRRNLELTGGLVYSGRLLLKLSEACGSREKAYRMVQRNAMAAWAGAGKFRELVATDSEIGRWLTPKEISGCFDLGYYLRNVDKIYKKCGL
jgi:adenylosuccinate lyase